MLERMDREIESRQGIRFYETGNLKSVTKAEQTR
jgi:hypothetical protein